MTLRHLAVVAAATIALTSSSRCAEEDVPSSAEPSWQVAMHSSYTAASAAKFDGVKSAEESDAYALELSIGRKIKLSSSWSLLVDLGSQNIYLDSIPAARVPDEIHTLRITTGVEFKVSEKWTIAGLFSPSLYRFEDVNSDDVGFSGGLMMAYRYRPTLSWSLGVFVSPNSSLSPVLPVGGLDWKINRKFELQLMFPKPRLLYQITSSWSVFAGGDLTGATFRTKDDFGTKIGFPKYNDALADYRDIRVGAGTGFQINRGIRLEVEGGYSVDRELNYIDIDKKVKFDPSPYIAASLKVFF